MPSPSGKQRPHDLLLEVKVCFPATMAQAEKKRKKRRVSNLIFLTRGLRGISIVSLATKPEWFD